MPMVKAACSLEERGVLSSQKTLKLYPKLSRSRWKTSVNVRHQKDPCVCNERDVAQPLAHVKVGLCAEDSTKSLLNL